MKKLLCAALAALLAALLCACASSAPEATLVIKQAELTQEEQEIKSLLGCGSSAIYDFALDDSVKTVRVERYQLGADGAWEAIGGGSFAASGEGRIALTMDPGRDVFRVAIQNENGTSSIRNTYPEGSRTGQNVATSLQEGEVKFGAGPEVPLVVQVITDEREVVSYSTEYFFRPEEYAQRGSENVFAVTVTFLADEIN